jgi:hypothetical protein
MPKFDPTAESRKEKSTPHFDNVIYIFYCLGVTNMNMQTKHSFKGKGKNVI